MTWTEIKDRALRYWFIISALALAILYILFDRRGRQLDKALADAKLALLGQKLISIKDRADASQSEADKASEDYEDLKRRHGDLLHELGISGGPGAREDKEND